MLYFFWMTKIIIIEARDKNQDQSTKYQELVHNERRSGNKHSEIGNKKQVPSVKYNALLC